MIVNRLIQLVPQEQPTLPTEPEVPPPQAGTNKTKEMPSSGAADVYDAGIITVTTVCFG